MPLNKFGFLMKKTSSPNCETCGTVEDVYHLLVECVRYEQSREKLMRELGSNKLDVDKFHSILASPGSDAASKLFAFVNSALSDPNLDNIVDLCNKLQDIKNQESASSVGMPTCTLEHTEAVRRYYAAFPALKKGQESPLQYYLPAPAWCRKSAPDQDFKMQSELSISKDWNKNKKFSSGKERRNSYHGQRKNRKRCNSYSRSFESKESLPEWVTHEGIWDMETQDPVKEFIRAIALDEGYGTCENTVTDEIKEINQAKIRMNDNLVPDWDDSLNLDTVGGEWVFNEDLKPRVRTPMEEELYAKFEAKFDRSIEALWSKDQNTPDDEYQDLPIDFQDLLSSPSDHLFADPSAEKCSLISLTESIWSNDGLTAADRAESPSKIVEVLHDRFKPLNLTDSVEPAESFALYEGEEIYDALSTVAETMRSFTAINHSRDRSGFAEVPPRRHRAEPVAAAEPTEAKPEEESEGEREDLLTSSRTHFRPIRRESEAEPGRYVDGDTFDIRGDLDEVQFRRSDSGGVYLESSLERYLEYRSSKSIDYGRLNLTAAQRCPDLEDPAFRLRFPVRQLDAAVQTDRRDVAWPACEECGRAAKKMRPSAMSSIWSGVGCEGCVGRGAPPEPAPAPAPGAPGTDELSREWEELLGDISAAHAEYLRGDALEDTLVSAERKRRHSAALRCEPGPPGGPRPPGCSHPHARFLHCAALALDRPLTR